MTAFLASVRSAAEARLVLHAGVDVLDVKEPGAGALGAVPDSVLREIVTCAGGAMPVSATIGDLPPVSEQMRPAIERTWQAGADIVKVGVFADALPEAVTAMLTRLGERGVHIVLVYFAELWRGAPDFEALRRCGVMGVMLDTRDKHSGSVTAKLGQAELVDFVRQAQRADLIAGLAGSLPESEIAGLLSLAPDYLGFRGALCGASGRAGDIDGLTVRRIADRIHATGRRGRVIAPRADRMGSRDLVSV